MPLRIILNWFALSLLIAAYLAIAIQMLLPHKDGSMRGQEFASLLGRIDAIGMREVPLGGTEYVDGVTREKMGYDWVANKEYNDTGINFALYIGYWAAGRRPVDFVASHTPDRCWPMAGFTCLDTKSQYKLTIGQKILKPAEWRRFSDPHARSTDVIFWHIVGGRLSSARYDWSRGDQYLSRAIRGVRGLLAEREPQFFVRLTSSQSLAELATLPQFQQVMVLIADATSLWETPVEINLD
jgi:hypothetical protein